MNVYEYRCPRCGHTAEVEAPEPPKRLRCDICGYKAMKRRYVATTVIFRGEGFTKSVKEEK